MSVAELGLTITGAVFVVSGVATICALVLWPITRRTRDTPLLDIRDPIELGWVSTARLLRPVALTTLIAGGLNLMIRVLASAA